MWEAGLLFAIMWLLFDYYLNLKTPKIVYCYLKTKAEYSTIIRWLFPLFENQWFDILLLTIIWVILQLFDDLLFDNYLVIISIISHYVEI